MWQKARIINSPLDNGKEIWVRCSSPIQLKAGINPRTEVWYRAKENETGNYFYKTSIIDANIGSIWVRQAVVELLNEFTENPKIIIWEQFKGEF